MKTWRKFLLIAVTVISFGLPATAHSIVFVVCRKFVPEKGCYKCSSYFSVQNEDEAQRKCARMGYSEPNYFGSVGAVFRWMLPNCDCGDDEE